LDNKHHKSHNKIIIAILQFIDKVIANTSSQYISLSIIILFILLEIFSFSKRVFYDYKNFNLKKRNEHPIEVNISESGINIEEEQNIEYQLKKNETLLKVLINFGSNDEDAKNIVNQINKLIDSKSILQENKIKIKFKNLLGYKTSQENQDITKTKHSTIIEEIAISESDERQIIVKRNIDGKYIGKERKIKINKRYSKYRGIIKNGLFNDGIESGISATAMMQMIAVYGYDIDFQRDIKNGDSFEMLVESYYDEDGKKVKDGAVLYSSLSLRKKKIETYIHYLDGKVEYFDAKGDSIRKSLLRTPINGARVSSGFGVRRHPILGYSKMHKGTDFAAPTGTPIIAAGNGTITYVGAKGGYGNFVQIRHNQDYSTAYGHASRFARNIRNGTKVKQGDVVAFVGSTGRSSGPHLHFEVIYKGNQINPASVKSVSGIKLSGAELTKFRSRKSEIDRYRREIPNQFIK